MKLHVKTEGSVENQTPLQKTIIADDDSAVVSNDKIMVLITQRIPWNSASFIFLWQLHLFGFNYIFNEPVK